MMEGTIEFRAHTWIVGHDTGRSSKTIWGVMMGVRVPDMDAPHDPDDFGRCYRLLQLIPEWRRRLHEVAGQCPRWKPIIEAWPQLARLYRTAVQRQWRGSPKLYSLLQAAQHSTRNV